MAQFDVYRVRGGRLVVDCQSDLLRDLPARFVVPLRPTDNSVMVRLTPVVQVDGQELVVFTPLAGSIDSRSLTTFVASIAEHEYAIKAAIDMLTSGI